MPVPASRFPPLELCLSGIDLIRDLQPKVKDLADYPNNASINHDDVLTGRSPHLYQGKSETLRGFSKP